MPVLPRVVGAAAALTVLALCTLVLGGCARFDAALGQQQAIVSFRSGTSNAERLAIRSACAKVPAVTTQPVPNLKTYPYALEQLTYGVNNASDADIAKLETCLNKFSSVEGVTLQDSSDDGNLPAGVTAPR
jgi:hypothetical protein